MTELHDKTVLVTGGASGIGLLMGHGALRRGARRLVIWDVQQDALERAVANLQSGLQDDGQRVIGERIDLADAEQIEQAAARLDATGVAVDILINNAGIVVGKAFAEHNARDIDQTMAVNALAPMRVARALLPGMLERGGGHIVNIASAAGLIANPGMSVYCASKWAVIGWSDSLRLEMERAATGVRITTVAPTYIDTGMFTGARLRLIPMLKPKRVAEAVLRAVEGNRTMLRLPALVNLLPLVQGILPRRWFDRVGGRWFGIHGSMDHFQGHGQ